MVNSKCEKVKYTICQRIADVLSFLVSRLERKQRFQGFPREEIALRNLRVVLKRLPTWSELDSVFFYHTLYHIQLAILPREALGVDDKSHWYVEESIRIGSETGAVFISAHLGLPELISYFVGRSGVDVFVLVESLRSRFERTFFAVARRRFLINLKTSIKDILRELGKPRGKIFAFLLDRPIPGSKTVYIFGRESKLSSIPFRMKEKFGLKVFGFKVVRQKEFSPPRLSPYNFLFSFEFEELEDFDDMVQFIEKIVKNHYLQWNPFCIYPFTF